MPLSITTKKHDTQHISYVVMQSPVMPSVVYAECRYAECHYAECRGTAKLTLNTK
jgi:hypothetical protein